jgi:hypothetical protein
VRKYVTVIPVLSTKLDLRGLETFRRVQEEMIAIVIGKHLAKFGAEGLQ